MLSNMSNSTYVGAVMADLHDGAFEAKRWYQEG